MSMFARNISPREFSAAMRRLRVQAGTFSLAEEIRSGKGQPVKLPRIRATMGTVCLMGSIKH